MLTKQLSDQVLHLESALFLANAQLAVAKLEKSSYQSAFEEAARQLSFNEAEVGLMQAQLTAKQSELEVSRQSIMVNCKIVAIFVLFKKLPLATTPSAY